MATEQSCVIYALYVGDHRYRYVGLTRLGAAARLGRHRRVARMGQVDNPLYRWMRKHGPERVQVEVLECVASPEDLDDREIAWIARLRSEGSDLLNCTEGGRGMRVLDDEVRAKLAHWSGRQLSPEHRAKLSEANLGKKHTPETRAKIAANCGTLRPEVAAKIRATKLGVPRPPDAVRKMRETKRARPTEPGNHIRWHITRDRWADDCEFCRIEVA